MTGHDSLGLLPSFYVFLVCLFCVNSHTPSGGMEFEPGTRGLLHACLQTTALVLMGELFVHRIHTGEHAY